MLDKKQLKKNEDLCLELNIGMIGYEVGNGRSYNYAFKFNNFEEKFYFTHEWVSLFGNKYSSWYFFNNVRSIEFEIERSKEFVRKNTLEWMENDEYRIL